MTDFNITVPEGGQSVRVTASNLDFSPGKRYSLILMDTRRSTVAQVLGTAAVDGSTNKISVTAWLDGAVGGKVYRCSQNAPWYRNDPGHADDPPTLAFRGDNGADYAPTSTNIDPP